MRVLALINARAGSKGVPQKNIRPLAGHPLIAWSIDVAKQVADIDRIVVSTDCDGVASIAKDYGADVPFMRPAELATDMSIQFDTIHYTVARLEAEGEHYDAVAVLQPTCPMRTVEDVENCIQLMKEGSVDTIITVVRCKGGLINALYHMDADRTVRPLKPGDRQGTLRQCLPTLYRRVGSVYLMTRDTVIKDRTLYGRRTKAVEVDESAAFDIDTLFDWQLVEAWVQARQSCADDGKSG